MRTLIAVFLASTGALAADPIQYNRDIRPILSENCFACHGPDSAARKADLRLDRRDDAVKARAFVPGKPDESELVKRILSEDPEERMPPPRTLKQLKAEEKATLRRWIAEGAEYQLHWSFIPPKRPELPQVTKSDWIRNPIDQFVLAKLEARGLEPAPEADRRSIARRLSLDLTGLPPDPNQVESFVNDPDAQAYQRFVDRLLLSDAWGEHRARYWLDVARYADTHGIHFDNYREMYAYRDWVIRAFNRNMPFDQFTVDQLAGDLLEKPSLDQVVASGFNRCNMTTNEGGAISEEYLVLYARDRTETTSLVWMGLTAGCAVCHNHKFDPLSQREFYELAAFFNNTTQNAMDGNIKDTPPAVPVPRSEDRDRWESLQKELADGRGALDERRRTARPDFDAWFAAVSPATLLARVPADGLRFHAPLDEGSGASVKVIVEGQPRELTFSAGPAWDSGHVAARAWKCTQASTVELGDVGDFERDQAFSCGAWVKLAKDGQSGSIVARMDDEHGYRGWDIWCDGGRIASHLVNEWDKDAFKAQSKSSLRAGTWSHVLVTYDGSSRASGLRIYVDGEDQTTAPPVDRLKSSMRTTVPFKVGQRNKINRIEDLSVQDVRIYGRVLSAVEVRDLAGASRAGWLASRPERSPAETLEVFRWWLGGVDASFQALATRLKALEAENSAIEKRGTLAHVMHERGDPPMAFILNRGEYDQRRDQVKADTPDVMPPFPENFPRNRLGFARWLLQPGQPLTARVTVNRFWQEIFGTGLVRTAGDFGVSGELPTHPELLDWLALEFRDSGWDVKRLFKLIVTSATYRQAAVATPEKIERDPQNRFFSRGSRFRMDAEMVRDCALASSGLLVRKMGGPSVRPYQPEGVWEAVAMMESNTRYYKQDAGESLYRRSLYTFWKRAAPPASMDIFNAPSREVCTVRRERTNTPLQALVTLNDPQFVESARRLAERALKEAGGSNASRVDWLGRQVLSRPFRKDELEILTRSLAELSDYYRAQPDDARALLKVGESRADESLDAASLAAWTMLSNEVLNLDEALNK